MDKSRLLQRIDPFVQVFKAILPHRDPRLFTKFLVDGYLHTTLDGVQKKDLEDVVFAKVCLGMIITLYDDLADNPVYYSPQKLRELYGLGIDHSVGEEIFPETKLAKKLFQNFKHSLEKFPHFGELLDILSFDIRQIFLANQFSELVTAHPTLRNLTEARSLGPYNMGMVAAGMVDLMASPAFELSELGEIREVLIRAQRLGRIGNLVSTYKREKEEGDLTNEIILIGEDHQHALVDEFYRTLLELNQKKICSFNVKVYADSIEGLFHFHRSLEGVI